MTTPGRHALVFGATGFIGRHLVLELARSGVRVTTATRSDASYRRLVAWLADHGLDEAPADVRVDFADASLVADASLAENGCDDVTEIHNCAAAYRFGMAADEARRANVDSVRAIVALAARLPELRRLVHVSGYRVSGKSATPWTEERRRAAYRTLGAYEASKVEADGVFQAEADRLGVPWTIVNPSGVAGDSATGESDQYIGLAPALKDLWDGTLVAVPGDSRTFVPVVAVDHLARFMALVPADASAEHTSYWLLDDATPAFPDLISFVAGHYRVKAPRFRVPVPVLKRLPQRVTKADPETLTFLSSDRYPTASADAFAARHGLTMPDTATTIRRWADHLAAHRFGEAPAAERRFTEPGGVRTFELGEPDSPTVVLPGLPVSADTWAPAVAAMGNARAVDPPGLGMSAGGPGDWPSWLAALVTGSGVRHLVGHSIGAAAALETATAHPVERLTLVAPFFLQARSSSWTPLVSLLLSRATPDALARRLTGDTAHADALASSAADLRRGTAATTARLLSKAGSQEWRYELQAKLRGYSGHVHVIVGAEDPLTPDGRAVLDDLADVKVTVVPGAGHHLQITHPEEVARAVRPARVP